MTGDESPAPFDIAARTHAGCVRETNEDQCRPFRFESSVGLVIADGVSGARGGAAASKLATEVLLKSLQTEEDALRPEPRLRSAVQRANIAVHDLALDSPALRGMATTLTAVVLEADELYATHIGDCRLYLLRAGRLVQLTKDHTVAAERVRLGVLSRARAKDHPARSVLTRSLGRELVARADFVRLRLVTADVLVLCSDGVHGLLTEAEIASLIRQQTADLACQALIDAANARGAPDNVSAAVAHVGAIRAAGANGRRVFDLLAPFRGR